MGENYLEGIIGKIKSIIGSSSGLPTGMSAITTVQLHANKIMLIIIVTVRTSYTYICDFTTTPTDTSYTLAPLLR